MTDAIRISRQRLACDAPGCSYEEPAELSPDLIGKPCPLCGSNLLTAEAYQVARATLDAAASINALYKVLCGDIPSDAEYGPRVGIKCHTDGLSLTEPATDAEPGHR